MNRQAIVRFMMFASILILAGVLVRSAREVDARTVVMSGCVFETVATGNWDDSNTWTVVSGTGCGDYPQTSDTANILDDHRVSLGLNVTCDTLDIEGQGRLWIESGYTLTLKSDSDVCGEIVGLGGIAGVIKPDSAEPLPVLRLFQATAPGDIATITGDLDIQIELDNDSTVVADSGDVLTLSEEGKYGTGTWKCTGGTLNVDAVVTGSSEWELTGGTVEFKTANGTNNRDGDVVITGGEWKCTKTFYTCGDLEFRGGKITTATGAWCVFGGNYLD